MDTRHQIIFSYWFVLRPQSQLFGVCLDCEADVHICSIFSDITWETLQQNSAIYIQVQMQMHLSGWCALWCNIYLSKLITVELRYHIFTFLYLCYTIALPLLIRCWVDEPSLLGGLLASRTQCICYSEANWQMYVNVLAGCEKWNEAAHLFRSVMCHKARA